MDQIDKIADEAWSEIIKEIQAGNADEAYTTLLFALRKAYDLVEITTK